MRKHIFFLTILFTICLTQAAWAIDLNSPCVKKITIESEIDRGYDAFGSPYYKIDRVEQLRNSDVAFEKIIETSKQQKTDTQGFYLGFYFAAWEDMHLNVETEMTYGSAKEAKTYQEKMLAFFSEFRRLQKELNISDDKLLNIVVQSKNKQKDIEYLKEKMKETESQLG